LSGLANLNEDCDESDQEKNAEERKHCVPFGCGVAVSRYRYAAVALAREFSAVLGGGIAPLLSGVLVALFAGWIGVVIYMTAIMLISLVIAIRMPETRGRDLRHEADA
jgi:predicted lipid-binding transport protein (Tim44 family)